jgi:hypothetical protein
MTVRTLLVIYIGALYATLNTAQLHAYLLLADHKYSIQYCIFHSWAPTIEKVSVSRLQKSTIITPKAAPDNQEPTTTTYGDTRKSTVSNRQQRPDNQQPKHQHPTTNSQQTRAQNTARPVWKQQQLRIE